MLQYLIVRKKFYSQTSFSASPSQQHRRSHGKTAKKVNSTTLKFVTIIYSWIPDKISIQEYKSARLDSPSSCSIVHYNVLVDWHLCHLRRAAVWARWKMLNNILVSRNTRPMPRSVMSIKLQEPFNLWNRCFKRRHMDRASKSETRNAKRMWWSGNAIC